MLKSHKTIVARLEALEVHVSRGQAVGPLTLEDCACLLSQLDAGNLAFEGGRVVLRRHDGEMAGPLVRFNAAMADAPPLPPGFGPRFGSIGDVIGFLNTRYFDLLDVDALDDEELVEEVVFAMTHDALAIIDGELRVRCLGCPSASYWARIAARSLAAPEHVRRALVDALDVSGV